MPRKNNSALFLVFAGCVLLSGCSSDKTDDVTPTVTVQAATVAIAPIESIVTADAILYPRDQAAITPRISAPVRKFYVDRGSRVHAGQLLAELENQDLQGAVTENQGGYAQAETAYQAALQKAQQDLTLAKQQLDAQQKIYDSRQNLLKQGAIAAKDVEDSRIALTQARDQYEIAQKQYDSQSAAGQLTAAKGKSESAAAQLSYTRIVSPIDGVVTDRPIYAGEIAPNGSPILTVMDLSQVIARAHISQNQIGGMKAGDSATISVVGQDEETPAKVTLVSPTLDPSSTTLEVWVQASNPGGRLKPGVSVRVSIVTSSLPKAVVAPAESVLTGSDGAKSVILLDAGNKPHKQAVKVGIETGDSVQITDGLKGGEKIVTTGAFELASEDDDVLAKTKIQVQAAPASDDDEKSK